MIRLSRLADYAVSLLSHMGKGDSGRLWPAVDLTEISGIPLPTVAKVLKLLAKAGIVSAQRGAAGGYRLAKSRGEISVAQIVEAMDGPIALTNCMEGSAHAACSIERICPMSPGWKKINHAVRKALQEVTLAEMDGLPMFEHAEGE